MKVAVVGAGWAGLAAGVRATQAGHAVTLFDMAPRPGGRARSDSDAPGAFDNGQHVLLGGYARTLALMGDVGVEVGAVLQRTPLDIRWPDGTGFGYRGHGPRGLDAFAALLRARGFTCSDKVSLVRSARAWRRARFDCEAALTAAELLQRTATPRLRQRLLDPLCVAALNTPVEEASARVFLAVLRYSLFGERDASDLLVPLVPLGQLLPLPAVSWLEGAGARVRLRERVTALVRDGASWRLRTHRLDAGAIDAVDEDGQAVEELARGDAPAEEAFDAVILATSSTQAAHLCAGVSPAWSRQAAGLAHEPIATLWLRTPRRPWPGTMLALPSDDERPAQFAFKLPLPPAGSALGAEKLGAARPTAPVDPVTLVVSAAAPWVARGLPALRAAAVAQAREAWGFAAGDPVECVQARIDRRATFRCVAGVVRPPARVSDRLVAAGDYVDSPYPATLEAAVRSGESAVQRLADSSKQCTP